MHIKTILSKKGQNITSVPPDASVYAVAKLFMDKRIGFALVRNGHQTTVGSISERDIIRALAERRDLSALPVADIMSTDIVTCDIDDAIDWVRDLMTSRRTRHVVVKDGYAFVGIASIGDIVKHCLTKCNGNISHIHDYVVE